MYQSLKNFKLYLFSLVVLLPEFFPIIKSLEFCKEGNIHRKCIPYNCTRDSECHNGSPGPYSRCLREFSQCECFHKNRPGIAVNSTCLPTKTDGDSCSSHLECQSIRGQSQCLGISTNKFGLGICGCKYKNIYHDKLNECLKLRKTEGSPCHEVIQCSHPQALGALAICDIQSGNCRCWDTVGDGTEKTAWLNGKCHYSRGENETCDYREECILGHHPNSDCLRHESYRNETVCTCPADELCIEEKEEEILTKSGSLLANGVSERILKTTEIFKISVLFVYLSNPILNFV